jgi:pyruvate,water dikinase
MVDAGATREQQRALILDIVQKLRGTHRLVSGVNADLRDDLTARFLNRLEGDQRQRAEELLELGRASYRLRDEDNLYLGRVKAELVRAVEEGKHRLTARGRRDTHFLTAEQVVAALGDPAADVDAPDRSTRKPAVTVRGIRARQLVGQPAGPGTAEGPARVVESAEELAAVRRGEVLVCDAISPTMTFVVPLVAAIVERRGGMLIHGAIIAREYGIPCVTGIPDATQVIHSGDRVAVDGYLGIVRVDPTTG